MARLLPCNRGFVVSVVFCFVVWSVVLSPQSGLLRSVLCVGLVLCVLVVALSVLFALRVAGLPQFVLCCGVVSFSSLAGVLVCHVFLGGQLGSGRQVWVDGCCAWARCVWAVLLVCGLCCVQDRLLESTIYCRSKPGPSRLRTERIDARQKACVVATAQLVP